MKIAVIGATGFVGTALVKEALTRGHEITAIARSTDKLDASTSHLTVKATDVFKIDALAEILKGHDAVVSAYNAGWTNPNLYDDFINGSEAIQAATKRAGVKRLLVVGGAGSLYNSANTQLVDSPEFPAEWKTGATAARDYLNTLRKETDLDWTFLSPAINLHPGERTGKFRLGTEHPVFDAQNKSEISVEDMAVAIVDELENDQFIKQRFTLGY